MLILGFGLAHKLDSGGSSCTFFGLSSSICDRSSTEAGVQVFRPIVGLGSAHKMGSSGSPCPVFGYRPAFVLGPAPKPGFQALSGCKVWLRS